ncbi:MAG TPA: hypothetical protein VGQ90_02020 [Stellaceae bacterium]|nr:hypothetical protein [Stellaceae bacterium]
MRVYDVGLRLRPPPRLLSIGLMLACLGAPPAQAHGFGRRYDLPLPLSLYLAGTAAAVIVSFVFVGLFARHTPAARAYPRLVLGGWIMHPLLAGALKAAAVGLLILTVAAGLFGDQDPYRNIAPTLVWIIWWVGLAMVSAFAGDLWSLVNPWRTLFEGAGRLYRDATGRPDSVRRLSYPAALGVWPAVALLLAVSWTELVFPSPAAPVNIARLVLAYSLLTWCGMTAFGGEAWLRHGDVFTVFFGLFARFAPTEAVPGGHGLALRPFGAGLLAAEPVSPSMTAFVLLALSSVLYDGALTTQEWAEFEPVFAPWLGVLAIRTIGLLALWAVFLGAYLAVCGAMSRVARGRSIGEIAGVFALTLVPIAIAYHLAHYLVYLLTQGQYLIPLASDPFGYSWNLFGTAGYRVDIAVVGARFSWYAAVAAIVTGHIAAVYLADVRAHQLFPSPRAAWRSQGPLTALMVVYTFVSLSILAEPIVERRASGEPAATRGEPLAIPADAVLPQPGTGLLQAVGPGHSAPVTLRYRVLGSAFHDGTRTAAADFLYAYSFAYRWSLPGEHHDAAVATATAPLRQRLRAIRVAGVDTTSKSFRIADVAFARELFLIDVYADIPAGEAEQDAVFAPPWSTLPWHLVVLMEEAVGRGWAVFSKSEAVRRSVPWLDLVRDDALKDRLAELTGQFERAGYRPPALQSIVGVDEATRRWAALAAFYREHGHFLVTNGPYRLKAWSATGATLEVFRDLSYPLGVGSYDSYAAPRRGYITKIERDKGGVRLSGDIETVMKFMRDYRLERQPLPAVDAPVRKRAAPECRYAVTDAAGRVVLAGTAQPQEDLSFGIELDSRLPAGRYTISAAIIVNGNAMNAEMKRIPVVVGDGR